MDNHPPDSGQAFVQSNSQESLGAPAPASKRLSTSIFRQEAIDHYRAGTHMHGRPFTASRWVERWYYVLFVVILSTGLFLFGLFRKILGS